MKVTNIPVWLRGAKILSMYLTREESELLIQKMRNSALVTPSKTRISQSQYGAIMITGKMRRGALIAWIQGFLAGKEVYKYE